MRVALISPYSLTRAAGNSVTTGRISSRLGAEGCTSRVFALEEYSLDGLRDAVVKFSPDLIHAFHAFYCGSQSLRISQQLGLPFIITMTGTDIYRAADYTALEIQLLRRADGITVFTEIIKEKLSNIICSEKISVIQQGVDIRPAPFNFSYKKDFTFLLPAGIRPVKNVLFPLAPVAQLAKKYPRINLHLVGEIIDTTYATAVLPKYDLEPSARWLGSVVHEKMPEIYANSSVVLNCSHSEGGMANCLLEAMQLGIPVLAADIEGNRSLVMDGNNGLLYGDEEDFLSIAERLYIDADLRSTLVQNGKKYIEENCSATVEVANYVELYRKMTGASS